MTSHKNLLRNWLTLVSSSSADSGHRRAISRRLSRLERSITTIHDELKTLAGSSDVCLIHQYEECLQALRTELGGTSDNLLDMEIEDSDDLCTSQSKLEKMTFDCALAIKRLLSSHPSSVTSGVVDGKGVKLPKLDAPTFDGKLINWRSFWDQFNVAIHSRPSLSKAEKLAYLRNSLKGGPAKGVIKGLSESGEFYDMPLQV